MQLFGKASVIEWQL